MKTEGNSVPNGIPIPHLSPDLVNEIITTASDIALLLSSKGRILSVLINPHHASFGDLTHWEGQPIGAVLTSESVEKLDARLEQLDSAQSPARMIELNHSDDGSWDFPVRYSLHQVKPDGTILMLGRDLRPVAEMQQQLVKAQMALERDYEAQREFDTRYRVLMEATRDGFVLVSMSSGRITDLNVAASVLLGAPRQDFVGAPVSQEFEGRGRGEFLESMANMAGADTSAPIELIARRSHKKLSVYPIMFRAAGERLLLCRLEPADATDAGSDELGENLAGLFHEGVDGIVFTDRDGVIRAANDAFLNLTDASNLSAVKGHPLSDFLARGALDLKVLLDNAKRAGHIRMYSTKVTTAYDGQLAAEISATWMNDRSAPVVVFVIRDASRAEALRRPGVPATDNGMRSVMDLVGSSTLKDIVAETTDVIEKMCIETAVELTRNNRVAAAEMLGLSRQSLYVKLRKYGLLNRDGD